MSDQDLTRPLLVKPHERRLPDGPGTPGMDRRVAIDGDGLWFGTVHTEPGILTGWHHHGDYDTYVYTLEGEARLDYLDGERIVVVDSSPGDVLFIPKGYVHREGSASEHGIEAVIVRVGHGQVVFPVDHADVPEAARDV